MSIKIENVCVTGFDAAIRGARNPMNSWAKSDSVYCPRSPAFKDCTVIPCGSGCPRGDKGFEDDFYCIGQADMKLLQSLCKSGPDHRKFMRFITVTADMTAPLFWLKELDTYKVGTVSNSCSTMHKLASRDLTPDDFSIEHLYGDYYTNFLRTIELINHARANYQQSKNKDEWRAMVEMLPSSYNQRRTMLFNYEVLHSLNQNGRRRDHKLQEWRDFCRWVDELPYYKLITGDDER